MNSSLDRLFELISSKRPQVPVGPVEYIIVGLGNPGSKYDGTRHNTGFMAIDRIAEQYHCKIDRLRFKGLCCEAVIAGKKVLLLKPSTFMNLSGQSVTEAASFYKVPMDRVVILFDDISLEPGSIRVRRKGTDGGHNGIKNIIYLSGRDDFPRVKIGVGKKPHPDYDLADWVLSGFKKEEVEPMKNAFILAQGAVEQIVAGNIDKAMNLYNGTGRKKAEKKQAPEKGPAPAAKGKSAPETDAPPSMNNYPAQGEGAPASQGPGNGRSQGSPARDTAPEAPADTKAKTDAVQS
ncbi:aminoacyl-tRNA hydrolase [Zongyangia hominis]|uniref:Peptidyl-tRNA hydrolase n=1 Tax=Zongyangia hominis TaxID=2763677 RepID=A0A926EE77_9FIRM|nr:aminoacyl-tRNA hydrolase [Zongyangia hominis]MBC8570564.1 aminoacyl-tRNA hydrolase [Zongyangia hominis]